ncbi:DUF4160 domain-containing protein [Acidisoma cladoniae]|jgi:hypothetical protein|uniref:DUF4160 domain-containing protein n=1 Tax=Acidisoma cladoniae TaxID=3040935 RepID=UPI00254AC058|nr:DUF4160 domain-containing protein [Acidisoma sp. PAMC 29798]
MPTVLILDGLRVAIYPNDHPPAHVHVLGPGWSVVINIHVMEVRTVVRCSERDARRAVGIVAANKAALIEAWRRIHG